MNNRRDRDAKLIAEAFHDDWERGRASEFARQAAAHARRRRRTRQVLAGTAACAAATMLGWLALREPPRPAVRPENISATKGYEIISDEELLAQVSDRTLLVVKKPDGAREFVVME